MGECVCFPIYADHATTITTVVKDVYKVFPSTSVFYPQEQVVESCLLAAATQGTPTTCDHHRTDCPKSVHVVSRQPRNFGKFPYCPTPGHRARQNLAMQTLVPRKAFPTSTTWGPLPTSSPKCKHLNKSEHKRCKNDECMWQFIKPYNTTTSRWMVNVGANNLTLNAGYSTYIHPCTTLHWGTPAPGTNTKTIQSTTTPVDTESQKTYSEHLTSIGMAAPKFKGNPVEDTCRNETDCRTWCDKTERTKTREMQRILKIGSVICGTAVFGILWVLYGKRLRQRWRDHRARRRSMKNGEVQEMELVEISPDGEPVLEFIQTPRNVQATGSFSRASEEGRGRQRVHFQREVDGATDAVSRSKISGHALHSASAPIQTLELDGSNDPPAAWVFPAS